MNGNMSNFYGLVGEKLGYSLSPEIHSCILRKLNKSAPYILFEVERGSLEASVKGLKALGCRGVNVTTPYKIEILGFLDRLSDEAAKIGSVNTLAFSKEGIVGYNTDYTGFAFMLKKEGIDVNGKKAVILGTGGVANTVLAYLLDRGAAEITFASRNPAAARERLSDHKIISYEELAGTERKDILINSTPCGMYPNNNISPADKDCMDKFSTVIDLNYNPADTLLLKKARAAGLKTANGLCMLAAQAAAAQEIWQEVKFSDSFVEELSFEVSNLI